MAKKQIKDADAAEIHNLNEQIKKEFASYQESLNKAVDRNNMRAVTVCRNHLNSLSKLIRSQKSALLDAKRSAEPVS